MATGNISNVRTTGKYGFQPVGGFIAPDPAAHWQPINGLAMNMQYAYGSVRSDAGDYWWPIRGFYPDRARYLHLSESKIGTDFNYATDENSSYVGPIVHGQVDGKWGVRTPDGKDLLVTHDDKLFWNEGDELTIEGTLVGDALQFFVADQDEPHAYTSRLFKVEGTIKGVPVSGLVFHDSLHMLEGQDFIQSSYITELEGAWVAFATEFEDGEIHAGHLIYGTQGFDLMIIHRTDGPPILARDLTVEVELDGEPLDDTTFPTRVTYSGAGNTWVWEANEGGRCPVRRDLPKGHRWRQGWAHEVGETRKPKTTEALMETYNGRLVDTGVVK